MAAPPPPYGEKDAAVAPPYGPGQAAAYPPPQGGYPPPQGGYPPQQPPMVVVQNVVFDRHPVQITCSNCHQLVQTNIVYEVGLGTWLIGCFVCICAFCVDACKDAVHMCPNCQQVLGKKALI